MGPPVYGRVSGPETGRPGYVRIMVVTSMGRLSQPIYVGDLRDPINAADVPLWKFANSAEQGRLRTHEVRPFVVDAMPSCLVGGCGVGADARGSLVREFLQKVLATPRLPRSSAGARRPTPSNSVFSCSGVIALRASRGGSQRRPKPATSVAGRPPLTTPDSALNQGLKAACIPQ